MRVVIIISTPIYIMMVQKNLYKTKKLNQEQEEMFLQIKQHFVPNISEDCYNNLTEFIRNLILIHDPLITNVLLNKNIEYILDDYDNNYLMFKTLKMQRNKP